MKVLWAAVFVSLPPCEVYEGVKWPVLVSRAIWMTINNLRFRFLVLLSSHMQMSRAILGFLPRATSHVLKFFWMVRFEVLFSVSVRVVQFLLHRAGLFVSKKLFRNLLVRPKSVPSFEHSTGLWSFAFLHQKLAVIIEIYGRCNL